MDQWINFDDQADQLTLLWTAIRSRRIFFTLSVVRNYSMLMPLSARERSRGVADCHNKLPRSSERLLCFRCVRRSLLRGRIFRDGAPWECSILCELSVYSAEDRFVNHQVNHLLYIKKQIQWSTNHWLLNPIRIIFPSSSKYSFPCQCNRHNWHIYIQICGYSCFWRIKSENLKQKRQKLN